LNSRHFRQVKFLQWFSAPFRKPVRCGPPVAQVFAVLKGRVQLNECVTTSSASALAAVSTDPSTELRVVPSLSRDDWRQMLPVLTGSQVQLRELRLSDAPSLLAMVTTPDVSRFISPAPTTVEGFERFIRWTHRERAAGRYICFAVVPAGMDTAVVCSSFERWNLGFRQRNGDSQLEARSGARGFSWMEPG
jgi:hypothetical protein